MPLSIKTGAVKVKDSEGDYVDIDLTLSDGYASLESPAFTGTPTAPTPGVSDDSTKIATTAFVQDVADNLSDAISDAATTNLLDTLSKTNGTVSGVTITWLGDGSVKANGTSSTTNWNTVYQSTTQMPVGIVAGQTYKASMKTTHEKLYLLILAYTGSWTTVLNTASSTPVSFTVPSNATGLWIRVNIQGGYTFSNNIAKPVIYAAGALSGAITNGTLINGEPQIIIPSNSNLNDYLTPGSYYVISDGDAATITNIPRQASGTLYVIHRAIGTYRTQIYYPTTSAQIHFSRNCNSGTWTAWQAISDPNENFAKVESGNNATQNYAKDDYVVVGGSLCKVTSPISNGAAFTLGTNIVKTTTGAEIQEKGISESWYIPMEIWDYATLIQSYQISEYIPNNFYARCTRFGSNLYLVAIYIADGIIDLSSINTMLQIKFPGYCKDNSAGIILGGSAYIGSQPLTAIQGSGTGLYFRPNVTKSLGSTTGVITAIFFIEH